MAYREKKYVPSKIKLLSCPQLVIMSQPVIVQARALQYCLEEDNNILEDDAWIVHLDEETLLTEASVRGIMNFITADKHSFGQGRS